MAMDSSLLGDSYDYLSGATVFRATDNYYHFFESGCWWESCSNTLIHTTWRLPFEKRKLEISQAFCSIAKKMDCGWPKKTPEREIIKGLSSVWSVDGPSVDGLIRRPFGEGKQIKCPRRSCSLYRPHLSELHQGYDILCSTSQIFFLQKLPRKRLMHFTF